MEYFLVVFWMTGKMVLNIITLFWKGVFEGPVRDENGGKGGEGIDIFLCIAMILANVDRNIIACFGCALPGGKDAHSWMVSMFSGQLALLMRRQARALPQQVVRCGPCWRIKNKLLHASAKVPQKQHVLFILALSYIFKYSDEYVAYVHTYIHHTQAPYVVLAHTNNISQRF